MNLPSPVWITRLLWTYSFQYKQRLLIHPIKVFVTIELLFIHNTTITFCLKCPNVSRPLSLKAILKWYRAVFFEGVIGYEWGEIYLSGHVSFGIKNNYYRVWLWLYSWIKIIHRLQFTLLFKIPLEVFKFIKLRLYQQGKGRGVLSIPNNQSWIFNRCLAVHLLSPVVKLMATCPCLPWKVAALCSESQKASTRARYVSVSSRFSFCRIKVARVSTTSVSRCIKKMYVFFYMLGEHTKGVPRGWWLKNKP